MKQYKDIYYDLELRKRKTMSIYIERDGTVKVLAPENLSIEEIEEVLESKRYWIHSKLEEWKELNKTKKQRKFVNGEGFLYLGRSYQLKLVETQDVPLKLYQGYFCLRKADLEQGREVFKEFYKEKGYKKVSERVNYYKDMLGVNPSGIKIMELRNRWASCSENGTINFHWKVAMAPMTIIDYIVVHELTHFIYKNHSDSFWNTVDKVLPDYLKRKKWLRENGASLEI
ncbi:M48 family metallopeptidase [Natranaerobius trueperi]|uniref:Metal-dependent hydrolase n=1 Tax=Natranaerobius trueperi TaxID=759412 RepID=A0A226BYU3_9FIRM|nr:SprT family zinc-dependent metalloprotease [Natranaerobius trueperi]OWZ84095.1 metal-dependent hydrolase [Natranaerobius trueperi]